MEPYENDWPPSAGAGLPKYSPLEQECIDYIESLPTVETECCETNEKLNHERRLWSFFQCSAVAIAQLYSTTRDNLPTAQNNAWNTFQQASTNVTCLYRESVEYHKRNHDVHHQLGYHKRTKELLGWLKKKKSLIRREELLAFLSGAGHPHNPSSFLHHNNCLIRRLPRNRGSRQTSSGGAGAGGDEMQRFLPPGTGAGFPVVGMGGGGPIIEPSSDYPLMIGDNNNDHNLETFKEAISLSNLRTAPAAVLISGNAMSVSPPPPPPPPPHHHHRRWSGGNEEDLNEFIDQQFSRHAMDSRKRTSSMDICMDSPGTKRGKFL